MGLPSLNASWIDGAKVKARIYVLEVRDRNKPKDPPIAWLLVERQEKITIDESDKSVFSASIRLSYEQIMPDHPCHNLGSGYFSGSYSKGSSGEPTVSLTSDSTSKGVVFLDLPGLNGQRIGTYLMNEIVQWVKQWPDAMVSPIGLASGQADDENRARRNRFYEQFGLVFEYFDSEQREGLSKKMPAKQLCTIETWQQNIKELDFRDYLRHLLSERDRLVSDKSELEGQRQSLRDVMSRAKTRPIRWALGQMLWKISPYILPLLLILIVCALGWKYWPG